MILLAQSVLVQKNTLNFMGSYTKRIKNTRELKMRTKNMDFDNYASRILTSEDAEEETNRFAKNQKQTRFQNNKGNR